MNNNDNNNTDRQKNISHHETDNFIFDLKYYPDFYKSQLQTRKNDFFFIT